MDVLMNPQGIETKEDVNIEQPEVQYKETSIVEKPLVRTVQSVAPVQQVQKTVAIEQKKRGAKPTTAPWSRKTISMSLDHQTQLSEIIEMEKTSFNMKYNERDAVEEAISMLHKMKREQGKKLISEMK